MMRALWVLLKAGLLVAAAVYIANLSGEGSVAIQWREYLIETRPAVLVALALVFALAVMLAFAVLRAVWTLPRRWRRHRAEVAREDAYRALSQGLMAIAAGDVKRAVKMRDRAAGALPDQPLTKLLAAQTAQLQGNRAAANRAFAELMDDPEGAFFGVRGLLNDSLARRDYAAARDYLKRADKMQPHRPWILRGLFDMETRARAWLAADKLLRRMQKAGAMDAAGIKSARQAVWIAQAMDFAANDHLPRDVRGRERLRYAQAAWRLDTAALPAALALLDAQIATGKLSAARKLLRRVWELEPNPQLAQRWLLLMPPQKPKQAKIYAEAEAQFDWMSQLAVLRPDHIESQRALGLAALTARRWRQARPLLAAAGDYRAMAQLERDETGNDAAARKWLEAAADAPPAEQWVCAACHHRDDHWQPLCPNCDSFNSFAWRAPDLQQGAPAPARLETPVADILSPPL